MPDDRGYENLRLWTPDATFCEGIYDMPTIAPVRELPEIARWHSAGQVRERGISRADGVQCYVYDYKLTGLWTRPTAYLATLRRAGCALSPDFSLYTDVPKALNLYNHYRKHWLGAYWQLNGVRVIPTICWADERSYDWCFDGEPAGSVVSVSSVGTQRYEADKRGFLHGYDAMMERLEPSAVLFFGNVPKECRGNIVPCETFTKQLEQRRKEKHV